MWANEFSTALARLCQHARRLAGSPCLLCKKGTPEHALCDACEETLPRPLRPCPVCSLPAAATTACPSCVQSHPPYDRTIAVYRYRTPVDRLMRDLKFNGRLALAGYLALQLERAIGAVDRRPVAAPDLVLAVPISAERLRQRGYNQTHEIARRLRLPDRPRYRTDLLRKVRDTPAQTGLAARQRQANLHDAFIVTEALHGRHVAVVDDVMTTGATLAEIALALKHAGAVSVENWVVARAERPGEPIAQSG